MSADGHSWQNNSVGAYPNIIFYDDLFGRNSLFTNSSCGGFPTLTYNYYVPTFPFAAMGLHYKYDYKDITFQASLYNGLSRLFKTSGKERKTIIIEVGMQNAAQAIAVATSPFIFNNQEMAIPAILYSLMMNVVLLIYVAFVKKK